ncbi:trypsin-like cysteine/serine peptidase domain-containing protein [Aspergillus egyptiacus]|nr:trypsin-like cysteine/serine peptidase domain-containing protein [Aspergillus egyptiacus]
MKSTLFALSLAAAAAPVLAEEAIVGGDDADITEYPYQIALLSTGQLICGGSIISPQYVVTAGHCTAGLSASSLSIRVGSTQASSGGTTIPISAITVHPDYNAATVENDISILTLGEELSFDSSIQAIDLPSSAPTAGTTVTATGWGATSEGGATSEVLQYVDVPVVGRQECASSYAGYGEVTEAMICAGESGKDACQGDSGGPLAADGTLVGITSWGNGCARPGYPGVYTNVAYFRDFIQSVTGI